MSTNTVSLESLLTAFRAGRSLEVSQLERLVTNGQNIGMSVFEHAHAQDLLTFARQKGILSIAGQPS